MTYTNNKGEFCEMMIRGSGLSEDARNTLLRINRVAASEGEEIKTSVKDLFLICPSGQVVSSIGHCYETIITCNGVYPVRGTRTYLALAFPVSGTDMDYKEFFASPTLAAATQNYFTGVFLISFEQWTGADDLIKDQAFTYLIRFINCNKSHMSFVFHVTPDFRDKENLYKELGRYVNLYLIEQMPLDKEYMVKYISDRLVRVGIEFDEEGWQEMGRLFEEKLNASERSSMDYQTLELLAESIKFELYAQFAQRQEGGSDEEKTRCFVGQEEIRMIADYIEMPDAQSPYRRIMGFKPERGMRHV